MKLTMLFVLLLTFTVLQPAYGQGNSSKAIAIFIDGNPLQVKKEAFVEGERLFIPLRAVFEQMGWGVEWEDKTISLSYQSNAASFGIALVLGDLIDDEDQLRIIKGSTFLESGFFIRMTDAAVVWNAATNQLHITSGNPENGVWGELQGGEEVPEDVERELSEEESIAVNFGKYEVPPTLKALIDVEAELAKEGYELWNVLGFYPSLGHSGYFNSPVDVVTFGWTGGDGEHFGFLTDFGSAVNLEEAPIVMVSPMNFDQPAVVVANNIREFMRIVMKDPSLLFMGYEDEQAYLQSEREMWEELEREYGIEETEADRLEKRAVVQKLEQTLKPPIIDDVYRYSENVALEREKSIVVPTLDKLGVTNVVRSDAGKLHPPLTVDEEMEASDLTGLLDRATYSQKLALIRDVNLSPIDYGDEFMETLTDAMMNMGLQDEVARFQAMYSFYY
ncbi:stalk domain-containing protein [Paenibacillus sp. YIM B09110]|uniref:stalk domain-containing protein n=1 Tax=Paenibacillus sp. YIM B09110 TaxID=3126102 RepID=UPI00301C48FB